MSNLSRAAALQVRDRCLCLHAQRAARVLARRFDEVLRPLGLTSGQYSLLTSLNRPAPPTIGEVATLLGMDRTTLTAALKPLERRRLVRRAPDDQDRRSRRLSLTARGQALLARALPLWRREHARLDALFSDRGDSLREELRCLARPSSRRSKRDGEREPPF